MPRLLRAAALLLISWLFTGCGVHDGQTGSPAQTTGGTPEILLFNGAGSSFNDVMACETILKDQHVNYSKVNSSQLNQMSEAGAARVGIDSLNIDDTADLARPVHSTLLGAGVPIVEHLCGLAVLPDHGARFFAVPVKVKAFGTFPVRAFALSPAES